MPTSAARSIGLMTIFVLVDTLKKGGHQVVSMEADKDLVDRLEDFMPQVLQGERPGMVFNVSYGLQGQARYTHVPSILEMVGIPYVASGPLGHSLALDKVVTKMVLRRPRCQHSNPRLRGAGGHAAGRAPGAQPVISDQPVRHAEPRKDRPDDDQTARRHSQEGRPSGRFDGSGQGPRRSVFMPQVLQGERPGMVFNVSYGLQGQARYTHVPSILEMVGIPYVASGPLGHSLALDKVVTKMVLRQRNIPTPDFAVLDTPQAELPADLSYPMIVKPRSEAVSFGLAVVQDEEDLRRAAGIIFNEFRQPVLAEQYIEGREINVGLLGNDPVEAFAPVLLDFGEGPQIYTYEDKTRSSGREIRPVCPAPIGDELTDEAKDIAIRTFNALGLYDCARIDMRLDKDDRLFVLEANSLPSLGEHGSYLVGAAYAGLDFTDFVNRLVDIASARYFGTPDPSTLETKGTHAKSQLFSYGSIRDSYAFVIDCLERQEVGLWTSGVSRCGFRRRAG